MNALQVLTSPALRKVAPVLGEVAGAFGFDTSDEGRSDDVISRIRSILPVISVLRTTPLADLTAEQLGSLSSSIGVPLSDEDAGRFITALRMESVDLEQSLLQYITGGGLRNLLVVTLGERRDLPPIQNVPSFDPETGIYNF